MNINPVNYQTNLSSRNKNNPSFGKFIYEGKALERMSDVSLEYIKKNAQALDNLNYFDCLLRLGGNGKVESLLKIKNGESVNNAFKNVFETLVPGNWEWDKIAGKWLKYVTINPKEGIKFDDVNYIKLKNSASLDNEINALNDNVSALRKELKDSYDLHNEVESLEFAKFFDKYVDTANAMENKRFGLIESIKKTLNHDFPEELERKPVKPSNYTGGSVTDELLERKIANAEQIGSDDAYYLRKFGMTKHEYTQSAGGD